MEFHLVDPESSVIIERVGNGFILTTFISTFDSGMSTPLPHRELVEIPDKMDSRTDEFYWKNVRLLLWNILDALEVYTSKHNSHNISIEVVPNEDKP